MATLARAAALVVSISITLITGRLRGFGRWERVRRGRNGLSCWKIVTWSSVMKVLG